jgi:hypothetical protein
MTAESARARRIRRSPGQWLRQHTVRLVAIGIILLFLVACCNLPSWPTVVWQTLGHECGSVGTGVAGTASSGATQAEACFFHAYQHCTATTLNASITDVDFSANYRFVIEPYGFTCAVGAIWTSRGHTLFNGIPEIGYCGSVRLETNGLRVLGCQGVGDVFVPGNA